MQKSRKIAKTIASANPSHIVLAGRNESKVAPVIEEIHKANPAVKTTFVQCDLADNASVRKAADQVRKIVDKIDVLLNNAGIMAVRTFQKSVDGVESQFAAGYLGHFLLTNLIVDKLVAANGIVLNMTSTAYKLDEVNTEDPNSEVGGKACAIAPYIDQANTFCREVIPIILGMHMPGQRQQTSYSLLLLQISWETRALQASRSIPEVSIYLD